MGKKFNRLSRSFGKKSRPPPPVYPPPPPTAPNKRVKTHSWFSRVIALLTCGHYQKGKRRIPVPLFTHFITVAQIAVLVALMALYGIENIAVNPSIGPSIKALRDWGAKDNDKIYDDTQVYRFLSPIILHSGIIHLVANVVWQLFIAARCEVYWGLWRVVLIYVVSGVGGNMLSCVMNPDLISVGASTSLSGIFSAMFADLIYNWNNRFTIPNPILSAISLTLQLVIFLLMGFVPLIDNWGHLGGFIVGFLLGMVIIPHDRLSRKEMMAEQQTYENVESETSVPTAQSAVDLGSMASIIDTIRDPLLEHEIEAGKKLRKPSWESAIRKIVILSRVIFSIVLCAYFAIVLSVFYTLVGPGRWSCKYCKYFDMSWLMYRL